MHKFTAALELESEWMLFLTNNRCEHLAQTYCTYYNMFAPTYMTFNEKYNKIISKHNSIDYDVKCKGYV